MPDRPPAKSTRKASQESNEMPAVKRGISHERDSSEGGPAQRKESEDRLMAARRLSSKINSLFRQCKWEQARNILEVAREQSPRPIGCLRNWESRSTSNISTKMR